MCVCCKCFRNTVNSSSNKGWEIRCDNCLSEWRSTSWFQGEGQSNCTAQGCCSRKGLLCEGKFVIWNQSLNQSINQSINLPILIRFYPRWLDLPDSNSILTNSTLHFTRFMSSFLSKPTLLLSFSTCIFHVFFCHHFLLPFNSNSNAFLKICPSSLLNTCHMIMMINSCTFTCTDDYGLFCTAKLCNN